MALAETTTADVKRADVRTVDVKAADMGSVASVVGLSAFLVEADAADVDITQAENWAVDRLVPANIDDLSLPAVLHALSDPVRLRIVAQLADGGERTCGSLEVPVAKSTCSHHFRVLREAGVVSQRADGKCRFNRLRSDALEQRFPGLLDAVLRAQGPADPSPGVPERA